MKYLQHRTVQHRNTNLQHGTKDNASVVDFVGDPQGLERAMAQGVSRNESQYLNRRSETAAAAVYQNVRAVEWKTPRLHAATSEPLSMQHEVKRLQILQSYLVLDSEAEEEFDTLTQLGSTIFNAPICLISLVDLGRQWFLSKVGLDAAETPRKFSFCSHAVQSLQHELVVPDARQDERFCDNPLVTGPPDIRFYGGAALLSPEGYKLGSFCVISPEVRPGGLNPQELEQLHGLSKLAVAAMVARRNRLLKHQYAQQLTSLATTVLETSQHLLDHTQENIQTVMSMADDDDEVRKQKQLMRIVNEIIVQTQIEQEAAHAALELTKKNPTEDDDDDDENDEQRFLFDSHEQKDASLLAPPTLSEAPNAKVVNDSSVTNNNNTTHRNHIPPQKKRSSDLIQLNDNLNQLTASQLSLLHPMAVDTVVIEFKKGLHRRVPINDLLLFRSCMGLLVHCLHVSSASSASSSSSSSNMSKSTIVPAPSSQPPPPPGTVKLQIRKTNCGADAALLIQCNRAGHVLIPEDEALQHYVTSEPLSPVATMVRTLRGQYGSYHGSLLVRSSRSGGGGGGDDNHDDHGNGGDLQTIYWIRIPYKLPKSSNGDAGGKTVAVLTKTLSQHHHKSERLPQRRNNGNHHDPFQKTMLQQKDASHVDSCERIQAQAL